MRGGILSLKSTKKILASFITAWYLLTWCGWGGDTKTVSNNNGWNNTHEVINNGWNEDKPKATEKLIGQVQAGPVKNEEVVIEDMYGNEIYRTETNTTGYYEIDKKEFEKRLKENWLSIDSELEIYTIGWVDTDTNDDGIIWDETEVNWKLTALLSYPDVNNSKITPISTLVTNYLLQNFQQVDKTKLNETAQKLWFSSYKDVLKYDMVKQESEIEKTLKERWYLDYIHKGYFENGEDEEEVLKEMIEWKEYGKVISLEEIEKEINKDPQREIEKLKQESELKEKDETLEKIE